MLGSRFHFCVEGEQFQEEETGLWGWGVKANDMGSGEQFWEVSRRQQGGRGGVSSKDDRAGS